MVLYGQKPCCFAPNRSQKNNTKFFMIYLAVSKISRTFAPLSKMVGFLQEVNTKYIYPTDIAGKANPNVLAVKEQMFLNLLII